MASEQEQYHGGLRRVQAALERQQQLTKVAHEKITREEQLCLDATAKYHELVVALGLLAAHHKDETAPANRAAAAQMARANQVFSREFPDTHGKGVLEGIAMSMRLLGNNWRHEELLVGETGEIISNAQQAVEGLYDTAFDPMQRMVSLTPIHYHDMHTHNLTIVEQIKTQTGMS